MTVWFTAVISRHAPSPSIVAVRICARIAPGSSTMRDQGVGPSPPSPARLPAHSTRGTSAIAERKQVSRRRTVNGETAVCSTSSSASFSRCDPPAGDGCSAGVIRI